MSGAYLRAPTPRKRRVAPVCLYVISDDRGHAKIGVARRPDRRCSELQTGNPYPLRVVKSWQFTDFETAYGLEQLLLSRSRRHNTQGEWVRARLDALVTFVDRYAALVLAGRKIPNVGSYERWMMRAGSKISTAPVYSGPII